jgi:hypothetical protein
MVKEWNQVLSNNVTDNKIIEHLNSFKCLRNLMSYEKEVDTCKKLNINWDTAGVVKNKLRPQKLNT